MSKLALDIAALAGVTMQTRGCLAGPCGVDEPSHGSGTCKNVSVIVQVAPLEGTGNGMANSLRSVSPGGRFFYNRQCALPEHIPRKGEDHERETIAS
jgi:hypothetical protein